MITLLRPFYGPRFSQVQPFLLFLIPLIVLKKTSLTFVINVFPFQLNEMNGKMIGRKPLYVAVAQRKEERKARLEVDFPFVLHEFNGSPVNILFLFVKFYCSLFHGKIYIGDCNVRFLAFLSTIPCFFWFLNTLCF